VKSEPQYRILHVVSALTRTGPGRNLVDFVSRARSRNWDSMALVIKDADPGLLNELQNAGCECVVLGQRTILPTPRMMAQVARRIRQYDPDLLQVSQCGLSECAVRVAARMSRKRALPIVSLVQTRARDYYLSGHGRAVWNLVRAGELCTRRLVTRYVTNATHLKEYTVRCEGVAPEKVRVIPNAVDTGWYTWSAEMAAAGRKCFDYGDSELIIGSVASITRVKDHPTLLRGFAAIRDEFPRARLLLVGVGRGDHANMVRALIASLGLTDVCTLAGNVSDVRLALAAMDVFALTSLVEGSPTALIEAMSMSRACVVTSVAAARELIRPGEEGLIVRTGDPEDLAKAFRLLLQSAQLRANLGAAARQRTWVEFSLDRNLDRYAALYDELLPSKMPGRTMPGNPRRRWFPPAKQATLSPVRQRGADRNVS
jgi:glycosyltransferase involved in cell wall biosynthesis